MYLAYPPLVGPSVVLPGTQRWRLNMKDEILRGVRSSWTMGARRGSKTGICPVPLLHIIFKE